MIQLACRQTTAHSFCLFWVVAVTLPVFVHSGAQTTAVSATTGGGPLRLLLSNRDRIVLAEIGSIDPTDLLHALNSTLPTSAWIRGEFAASRLFRLVEAKDEEDEIITVDYNSHTEVLFWTVNSDLNFIRYQNYSAAATGRPLHSLYPDTPLDDDTEDEDEDYVDNFDRSRRKRRRVADHSFRSLNKNRRKPPKKLDNGSIIKAEGLVHNDPLMLGNADGMAYDWIGNNLYWSDSELKRIEVVSLKSIGYNQQRSAADAHSRDSLWKHSRRNKQWDSSGRLDNPPPSVLRLRKLLFTNLDLPYSLTAAPTLGWLFWSERRLKTIERGAMNGGMRTTIVSHTDDLSLASDDLPGITLTFDHIDMRLYWAVADSISACNFDGSGRFVVTAAAPAVQALSVFAERLFWTSLNYTDAVIMSDKFNGKEKGTINVAPHPSAAASAADFLFQPHRYADVRVVSPFNQPIWYNPCDNANCSGFCLVTPITVMPARSVPLQPTPTRPITYQCACPTGVGLKPDGKTCYSSPRQMLLIARGNDVRVLSLESGNNDNSSSSNLVNSFEPLMLPSFMRKSTSTNRFINGVAFDKATSNVYWSELKLIQRVKLHDASQTVLSRAALEAVTVVNTELDEPEALALDWKARSLYWTDVTTGRIEMISIRRDLPTTGRTISSDSATGGTATARRIVVSTPDLDKPRGIAVDPINGYLFWSDWGKQHIARSNLDGTNIFVVAHSGVLTCNSVTVDRRRQKVYWVNGVQKNTVEVANYDGSARRIIASAAGQTVITVSAPFAVAVLGDFVYWSNRGGSAPAIVRANRFVDNPATTVISTDLLDVFGFAAIDMTSAADDYDELDAEMPAMLNPCTERSNFSGCQHFCMFVPHTSTVLTNKPNLPPTPIANFYCACGAGFQLDPGDGKSCVTPEASLMLSTASGIYIVPTLSNPSSLELIVRADRNASEAMSAIQYEPHGNSTYWISTFKRSAMLPQLGVMPSGDGNEIRYEIRRSFGNSSAGSTTLVAQTVVEFAASGKCEDISIDHIAGNLYWIDVELDQIEVARLDGSLRRVILWERVVNPASIAVDPVNGHIYWTQFGVDPSRGRVPSSSSSGDAVDIARERDFLPQIRQAGLDGSEPRTLFHRIRATSLVIDYESQQIYWFNADASTIESYPLRALPGADPQVVVASTTAKDIAVYHGWLYWISNNGIERVNRTDNSTRTTVSLGSFLPQLASAELPPSGTLTNNTKSLLPPRTMPIQTVVRSMLLFHDITATMRSKTADNASSSSSSSAVAAMSSPGWNLCARPPREFACPPNNGLCFAPLLKLQQSVGNYKCQCQSHYALRLLDDSAAGRLTANVVCQPPVEFLLYSTANNEIGRYLISPRTSYDVPNVRLPIKIDDSLSQNQSFPSIKPSAISALEFDASERVVYWINKHTRTISRADENGRKQHVFVTDDNWRKENMQTFSDVKPTEAVVRPVLNQPNQIRERPRPLLLLRAQRIRRHVRDALHLDAETKYRLVRSPADSLREDFIDRAAKTAPPPPVLTASVQNDEIQPFDMTVDPYSRHLLWSCALHNRINVTHLDSGTALGAILDGSELSLSQFSTSGSRFDVPTIRPRWLALHWHERVLYFVNTATDCIESVVLDGSSRQQLVCGGGKTRPRHLAVDQATPALYWIDSSLTNGGGGSGNEYMLKRMALSNGPLVNDPKNSQKDSLRNELKIDRIFALPKSAGIAPFSASVGNLGDVYWAAVDSQWTAQNAAISHIIAREEITSPGSSQRVLSVQSKPVLSGARLPNGRAGWLTAVTGVSASSYYIDPKHPCNGFQCSHFCVLGFERRAQCACPTGMELSSPQNVPTNSALHRRRPAGSANEAMLMNTMPLRELTSICVPRVGCDYMCAAADGGGDERKCLSRDKLCDWHRDCPDGSDEYNCNACQLGGFKCASSSKADSPYCVLQHSQCGEDDRSLSALFNQQSNSQKAANTNNNSGEKIVGFGERVWLVMKACPKSYWTDGRCDDRRDCDDGSDELECDSFVNQTKKFFPVGNVADFGAENGSSNHEQNITQSRPTVISDDAQTAKWTFIFSFIAAVAAISLVLLCICCCRRRRKQKSMNSTIAAAAANAENTSPLIDPKQSGQHDASTNPGTMPIGPSKSVIGSLMLSENFSNAAPSSIPHSKIFVVSAPTGGAPSVQQNVSRLAAAEVDGLILPPVNPACVYTGEPIYTASVVGPAQAAGKHIRMPSPPPASSAVALHGRDKPSAVAQIMLQEQRRLNHPSVIHEHCSPSLSAPSVAPTPNNIAPAVQVLPNGGFYVSPEIAKELFAAVAASAAGSAAGASNCRTPMFRPPTTLAAYSEMLVNSSLAASSSAFVQQQQQQQQHRPASLSPAATAGNNQSSPSTATSSSNVFQNLPSQHPNYFQQLQQRQQLQQLQHQAANHSQSSNALIMSRDSRTRQSQHSRANNNAAANFSAPSALPPLPTRPPLTVQHHHMRPAVPQWHENYQHFCDPGGGGGELMPSHVFNAHSSRSAHPYPVDSNAQQQQHNPSISPSHYIQHQQQQQPYYPAVASPFCTDSQRSTSFAIAASSGGSESHYANMTPTPASALPCQYMQQQPNAMMPGAPMSISSASSYRSGGDTPRQFPVTRQQQFSAPPPVVGSFSPHFEQQRENIADENAEPIYENASCLLNSNQQFQAQSYAQQEQQAMGHLVRRTHALPASSDVDYPQPPVMPYLHNTISRDDAAHFAHMHQRNSLPPSEPVRPLPNFSTTFDNISEDRVIRYGSSDIDDENSVNEDDVEDDDSVLLSKLLVESIGRNEQHPELNGSTIRNSTEEGGFGANGANAERPPQRSPVAAPRRSPAHDDEDDEDEEVATFISKHQPDEHDVLLLNSDMPPPQHCGGETFAKMPESQFNSDNESDDDDFL